MDRLAKVLDDLKNKKISLVAARERLEFLEFNEQNHQYEYDKRREELYTELLLTSYQQEHSKRADDIICEKERQREIVKFLEWVRELLSNKQWDILWLYVVDNWTYDDIGIKYGIKKAAVCRLLERIMIKIQENVNFYEKKGIYSVRDLLLPNESKLEISSPKVKIAFPGEFLAKVNANGYFNKNGEYITKEQCKIPEYLGIKYNGDKNIWCSQCYDDFGNLSKCSRRKPKKGSN